MKYAIKAWIENLFVKVAILDRFCLTVKNLWVCQFFQDFTETCFNGASSPGRKESSSSKKNPILCHCSLLLPIMDGLAARGFPIDWFVEHLL